MKASHRKDVIIARIIFAIICSALLAGIISLIVWLHGRNAGKFTPSVLVHTLCPSSSSGCSVTGGRLLLSAGGALFVISVSGVWFFPAFRP